MKKLLLPWFKDTSKEESKAEPSAALPETASSESEESPSLSSEEEKAAGKSLKTPVFVPVHSWFVTFMCMNIPIIGWIYLLILAFSPSKGPKRDFAKAYLLYKLVFLLLSLAILAVALHYGLLLLDKLLAYMEML